MNTQKELQGHEKSSDVCAEKVLPGGGKRGKESLVQGFRKRKRPDPAPALWGKKRSFLGLSWASYLYQRIFKEWSSASQPLIEPSLTESINNYCVFLMKYNYLKTNLQLMNTFGNLHKKCRWTPPPFAERSLNIKLRLLSGQSVPYGHLRHLSQDCPYHGKTESQIIRW